MDGKPLSKQERTEIARCVALWIEHGESEIFTDTIGRLLAAEKFWREAMKHAHDEDLVYCVFCERGRPAYSTIEHGPDCPWKLAQD